MPALERRISLRGPRFWQEGETLMFCNQIDGSTRDGPREATDADAEAHPEAFAAMGDDTSSPGKPMITVKNPPVIPPPEPKPFAARRDKTREQFERS
jgi:hypothetical protein